MSVYSHRAGFSLIELMVAVAIAAILAAFGIPAYRDHTLRSYTAEATSGLLSAWAGGLLLIGYAVVLGAIASITTLKRDIT